MSLQLLFNSRLQSGIFYGSDKTVYKCTSFRLVFDMLALCEIALNSYCFGRVYTFILIRTSGGLISLRLSYPSLFSSSRPSRLEVYKTVN